jgi:hypothetical protein
MTINAGNSNSNNSNSNGNSNRPNSNNSKVLVKGSGQGNVFLAAKHVPNVITRLPMYRRNLTLVKFK